MEVKGYMVRRMCTEMDHEKEEMIWEDGEGITGAVRHLKETEGGRRQVSKAMEEFSRKIVIKEKEGSAIKMIARGKLTMEEIAEDLGLPVERVEELAKLQPV